jgi:hypothetical protein
MPTTHAVSDRSALKALSPSNADSCIAAGMDSANDGGGGLFLYHSASTKTADDVTVITPDSGIGRWERVFSGPVDVRWFGAKGGGTTPDHAAIQNALCTKRDVYLPRQSSEYRIENTLKFYSGQRILGDAKVFSPNGGGTKIVYYGTGSAFAPDDPTDTRDVTFQDLTIDNKNVYTPGANSIGIDFEGTSYSQVIRCSLRRHNIAVRGLQGISAHGYYNKVEDCEIASCEYGVHLGTAANSWRILGGRFKSCGVAGVWVKSASGNHISSTFETCGVGVRFICGASRNFVIGSYFEKSTCGAVVFDCGAVYNVELANKFSDSMDYVRDNDGTNLSQSVRVVAVPATVTGYANGRNLIYNGDFEVDSNGDGIADGLQLLRDKKGKGVPGGATVPAGTTLSLDKTTPPVVGTQSQKYAVGADGTSGRRLARQVSVTPGQHYVFTGWVKIQETGSGYFRFMIGKSYEEPSTYHNSGLITDVGHWRMHRVSFRAETSDIYVFLDLYKPSAGDYAAWIDGFKLEAGHLPTQFEADSLPPTTIGNPLTITGGAITVTHPIHHVGGSGPLSTINAPVTFAGEVTLIPDAVWSTITTGNIANVITAQAHEPVRAVCDPRTSKWYVK